MPVATARKSHWERRSQRRPLRLGTDPDGYPIELKRGFVGTAQAPRLIDGRARPELNLVHHHHFDEGLML